MDRISWTCSRGMKRTLDEAGAAAASKSGHSSKLEISCVRIFAASGLAASGNGYPQLYSVSSCAT